MSGSPLPTEFAWLAKEPGPRLLKEVLALYGVKEFKGPANNPIIMAWAENLGLTHKYKADVTPWCGLGMAYAAKRAGWEDQIPKDPLWALNWAKFGEPAKPAMLGDILVFERPGGGHVGVYVGHRPGFYWVAGFNQKDSCSIVSIEKKRLVAARQPRWRRFPPANRRSVLMLLKANGTISRNEV
jgi:uncharacterized protein (TIGR02594 family)